MKAMDDERRQKVKKVLAIGIAAAVVSMLYYIAGATCLFPALSGLVIIIIFRLYSIRGPKNIAILGTVVLLLTGLLIASLNMYVIFYTLEPAEVSEPGGLLTGGEVSPFDGGGPGDYTFSVVYANPNGSAANLTLHILDGTGLVNHTMSPPASEIDIINGTRYSATVYLDEGVYRHYYEAGGAMQNDTWNVTTSMGYGPIATTVGDSFPLYIVSGLVSGIVGIGLFFYPMILLFSLLKSFFKRPGEGDASETPVEPSDLGPDGADGEAAEEEDQDEGEALVDEDAGGEEVEGSVHEDGEEVEADD